jgi:hypothetical protein
MTRILIDKDPNRQRVHEKSSAGMTTFDPTAAILTRTAGCAALGEANKAPNPTTSSRQQAQRHKETASMRKIILAVTTAAIAALAITVAAAASTGTKTEHFSFIDTSDSSQAASAIATGAFTTGGATVLNRGTDTLRLSHGTIKMKIHFTHAPQTTANPTTCLVTEHSSGTYTLADGTGTYTGLSGSGRFAQAAHQVGPTANGKCSFASGNPVASQQIVTASGPVSLP